MVLLHAEPTAEMTTERLIAFLIAAALPCDDVVRAYVRELGNAMVGTLRHMISLRAYLWRD